MSQVWISDFPQEDINPQDFIVCIDKETGDGYYVRTHHLDILAPYRYRTITLYNTGGASIEEEFLVDVVNRTIEHVRRPTWKRLGHLDDSAGRKRPFTR